ncbi:hypothetical protein COS83_04995 [archaeon CG07_land_8_20_14_0_80_38_8]|nr:MAG: hypothetical protein COS83_04995 [archaeon CG07_land_8_20_14_0_80_38_8]PIU88929.1 MAG: hypothetical protein COS64_02055 [archaeon CG06_land_8_20_14_3_00_37_11]
MSIDELLIDKNMNQVINSLNETLDVLKDLTHPLRITMNPEEKKKDELFRRVRDLRLETEKLVQIMNTDDARKDLKTIREITSKVKSIVEEKNRLKEEIRLMNEIKV